MLLKPDYDKSQKSIAFLKTRIKELYTSQNEMFFPDDLSDEVDKLAGKEVDIFLFGSFVRSLLESSYWSFEKMTFHVLHEGVKRVMVEQFSFAEDEVSVIPRKHIEKDVKQKMIKEYHFVYAGRINQNKNIETLIYFFYYLQQLVDDVMSLTLIGSFDEEQKIIYGQNEAQGSHFEQKIKSLIDRLDWRISPQILPEQDSDRWMDSVRPDSTFISLSTSHFEDFGVAVTQAKEKGWPLVLSDWGGHREVEGDHVIMIPYGYLPQFNEFEVRGKQIAQFFLKDKFKVRNLEQKKMTSLKSISNEELALKRKFFFARFGRASHLITRDHWEDFYHTASGIKLVNHYRKSFRGERSREAISIVTNDLTHDPSSLEKINDLIQGNLSKEIYIFGHLELISPDVVKTIINSREVYTTLDLNREIGISSQVSNIFSEFDIRTL